MRLNFVFLFSVCYWIKGVNSMCVKVTSLDLLNGVNVSKYVSPQDF